MRICPNRGGAIRRLTRRGSLAAIAGLPSAGSATADGLAASLGFGPTGPWASPAWTVDFPGSDPVFVLAIAEDRLYATTTAGVLRAISTADGSERWSFERDSRIYRVRPDPGSGTVFAIDGADTLYAIEAASGEVRWRAGDARRVHPAGVAVFVLGETVHARSSASGDLLWRYAPNVSFTREPVVDDRAIYVGTSDGLVHAVARADGSARWTTALPGEPFDRSFGWVDIVGRTEPFGRGPAAREPTLVVSERGRGRIHGLSPADGEPRWLFETGTDAVDSPAVVDRDAVYVTGAETVAAIDGFTGAVRWRFAPEGVPHHRPRVANGRVYTHDRERLYALGGGSGTELWRTRFPDDAVATVRSLDGTLGGSDSGALAFLGTDDGRVQWRFDPDATVTDHVSHEGMAYLGTEDGRLTAVEPPSSRDLLVRDAVTRGGPALLATGLIGGAALAAYRRRFGDGQADGHED